MQAWVAVEDERNVEVGTQVRITETGVEGVTTAQFWDVGAQAYLVVVEPNDEHWLGRWQAVNDGGPWYSCARLVVHPANLTVQRFTYHESTEDCPVCSDCGQESHGEGPAPANQVLCDECALDLDVDIQPWAFVIDAQLVAENEIAEEVGGRRRRQNRERTDGIRRTRTPEVETPEGWVSTEQEIPAMLREPEEGHCNNQSSHGYCTRLVGHDGLHCARRDGAQWEDDGTTVTYNGWMQVPVSDTATHTYNLDVSSLGADLFHRPLNPADFVRVTGV